MLNNEFKMAQKILAGKYEIGILKITKTFVSSCSGCGKNILSYCVGVAECKSCDTVYIIGSIWKESVTIVGQTEEVVALVGKCPRCHRKNMGRYAITPTCLCGNPSERILMPKHHHELNNVPPLTLLWKRNHFKNILELTWNRDVDVAILRCTAKLMK